MFHKLQPSSLRSDQLQLHQPQQQQQPANDGYYGPSGIYRHTHQVATSPYQGFSSGDINGGYEKSPRQRLAKEHRMAFS
ncbi:hypothetical protein Leryth_024863 [Lithospermum erythrorhizon]|nr:hypothetical protein Leryth_024863 [Lithospermum erythrorhizon]